MYCKSKRSSKNNQLDNDMTILNNYNGFDTVYKISTIGDDVVIKGNMGALDTTGSHIEELTTYWNTGSSDWFFTGSALHFNEALLTGDTNVISQSHPDGYGIHGLQQFEVNKSYQIDFNVSSYELGVTSQLRFGLGNGNSDQDGDGASDDFVPPLKTFTISGTGDKTSTLKIDVHNFDETKNYLTIEAVGSPKFSG